MVYLPINVYNELLRINTKNLPHQDTIEDKFRECGLALKYLRKWFRQKLKLIGIDSETIEAFQGRVKTIGGKHYTDWIPILDREYEKIMKKLLESSTLKVDIENIRQKGKRGLEDIILSSSFVAVFIYFLWILTLFFKLDFIYIKSLILSYR